MMFNFNIPLKNLEGTDMIEMSIKPSATGKKQEDLTDDDLISKSVILKSVVANQLYKSDKIEDKARAFKLAQMIYSSTKGIEIEHEDIIMIKEVVKPMPVMYSGQILIMLEENV